MKTVSTTSRDQFDDQVVDPDDTGAADPTTLAPLTAFDRCDSKGCGAQAYLRVRLESGLELVFCGHHGHVLAPTLAGRGAVIRDDTHTLVENRALAEG